MDMDTAATVLAGSILTGLSLIIAVCTIIVINNLLHKYWKPIQWMRMQDHPFYTQSEPVEPIIESTTSTTTSATVVLQQK
jgi:hypothetical protein